MSKANETRGEVSITFEGVDHILRPSWEAIVAFEQSTGKSLVMLARAAQELSLTSTEVAQIVTECVRAGLKAKGDPMADNWRTESVGKAIMVEAGGFATAQRRLALLLLMAATGGCSSSGEVLATARK